MSDLTEFERAKLDYAKWNSTPEDYLYTLEKIKEKNKTLLKIKELEEEFGLIPKLLQE